MRHIYTGLDIGSNAIKLVVCELFKNKLNLLAATETPSIGIKKGLIVDVEAAKKSIKKAIEEIESMLGMRITKVIVNVPTYHSNFEVVKGSIPVQSDKNIITGEDVTKVLTAASKKRMVGTLEMVTDLPIDFKVDDKNGVKEPKGLLANILEVRSVIASVPKKNIYSVASLLDSMGIEIVDISLNPIANMANFCTKEIKESLSALIDIGYETTTVSLYNKGILIKNEIIPLGSEKIDSDLAYIYKITQRNAKIIKEKFALAHKRNASVNDFYEVTNSLDEKIKVSQFEASEIVMARIEEILTEARKELTSLTSAKIDYIIITGGISNMADFDYIANDVFGKKSILGHIKMLGIRNNVYAVAIGNVIHFITRLKLIGEEYTMMSEEDEEELFDRGKGINISSDSMLGKVFGYFFNE